MPPYDTPLATTYTTYLLEVKQRPLENVLDFMSKLKPFESALIDMGPRQFKYFHRRLQEVNQPDYLDVKAGYIEHGLRKQIDHEWKQWKRYGLVTGSDTESSYSPSSRIIDWDDGNTVASGSSGLSGGWSEVGSVTSSGSRPSMSNNERQLTVRGLRQVTRRDDMGSTTSRRSGKSRMSGSDRSTMSRGSRSRESYDGESRSSWTSVGSCGPGYRSQ